MTTCPRRGDADRSRGDASGHLINLTCDSCGATWQRNTTRRYRRCGSDDLRYTPRPLWGKGRGNQRTPVGRLGAFVCNAGDGADVLRTS
jgi:hypothetical protein